MFSFLKKKEEKESLVNENKAIGIDWTDEEKTLLISIWKQTSLSKEEFDVTYKKFITNALDYLSHEPIGGWPNSNYESIKKTVLILINTALRIRQRHIIPKDSKPEDSSYLYEVISFVIMVCVVLEQIGHIVGTIKIRSEGKATWCPFLEPLPANSNIIGRKSMPDNFALLFLPNLLNREGQTWLAEKPEAFVELLNYFSCKKETEINRIIKQAIIMINQNNSISTVVISSEENAVEPKVSKEQKVTEEHLKKVEGNETINEENNKKSIVEDIKNNLNQEPLGWKFIYWVQKKIKSGEIDLNDEISFIKKLDDGGLFLVIPDAFLAYEQECKIPTKKVKNQLTRLKLHLVKDNGNNIFFTKSKSGEKKSGLIFKDEKIFLK